MVDGYLGAEGFLELGLEVIPNQATLGTYPNTTVIAGQNTTVTPSAAPTGVTNLNAFADPGFTGVLTADPTTGEVNVTDALQAGTYTVTVNANGGCGTSSFTLTVTDPDCSAQFMAATDIAVGGIPNFIATADFNGDGIQDFATANGVDADVSIRLGDGTGGFTSATDVAVGDNPFSIAIGDFNGDGIQDFATTNLVDIDVSIRLGDGTGGFSSAPDVLVGVNPYSIAIGDFNGDGIQDFAIANNLDNDVSIRLGDGTGGFTSVPNIQVGNDPRSIAIGDFNGDGIQDFSIANFNDSDVSIRLGDGTGNFTSVPDIAVGVAPNSVAIGDFNADGIQDFAAANAADNDVSIRLGDGTGGFTSVPDIAVGLASYSVAIGDFNGDGIQDFATANRIDDNVSIRLGDGTGGFTSAPDIAVGDLPYSIAIGDFNGDGIQDFATANHLDDDVSIRLGEAISLTGPNQVDVSSSITLTGNGTAALVDPWVSSNTGVATVDANGEVTGVAAGTVDITYTTESGCSDVLSITVNGVGPANDSICNASPLLFFGQNYFGDISGAGAEAGEPTIPEGTGPNGSCQSQDGWCNPANGGSIEPFIQNSVWFTFIAPASGNITLNTETSTYDTQIAVFGGNDCNDILNGNGTLLGANDDISGGIYQSEVTVTCLTPGETYFILVDGWLGDEGNLMIEMTDNLYLVEAEITPTSLHICDGVFETLSASIGADFTYDWTPGGETDQSIDVVNQGTYEVMVTDSNGCVANASIVMTTEITPEAGFASSSNGLTADFTDMFNGTIDSHDYDFGDGTTSASSNPSHTYAASGTYTVCVTVYNNCGFDTDCQSVTVDVLTGIVSQSAQPLLLYPNPTDGQFTIELNGLEGQGQLKLMDMTGRMVYSEAVTLTNNFKQTLDLDLASGAYTLQVVTEQFTSNIRLEVQ